MKTIFYILLTCIPITVLSQTPAADELIKVHSISDENTLNGITAPAEGSLGFNTENQKLYVYSNNTWRELLFKNKVLEKTSDYTLTPIDDGAIITMNSATDVTLTIPSGLLIGYSVSVYQTGSGKITFTGSGATVKNRLSRFKSAGQDAGIGIVSTSTDTFHLTGDVIK